MAAPVPAVVHEETWKMNNFGLAERKRFGRICIALLTLAVAVSPALAAPTVTSTPGGLFIVNGNTVTTGTSTGTFTGVTVTNAGVATTVNLGQPNGTTLTLNDGTANPEINIGTGSSVTVQPGTTLNTTVNTNVILVGGGTIVNAGDIFGYTNGVNVTGAGTLANTGLVFGINTSTNPPVAGNDAVLFGSGSVNNSGNGFIEGFVNGVAITGAGSVNNSATIFGMTNGVNIGGAGTVANSGTIFGVNNTTTPTGGNDGVLLASGSVSNSGAGAFIEGFTNGIEIDGAGSVGNSSTVFGMTNGIDITGAGAVTNSGQIFGVNNAGTPTSGNDGVLLASGTVNNTSGGLIDGFVNGIEIDGAGGVVNVGQVSGLTNGVDITGAGAVVNSGVINSGNAAGDNDGVLVGTGSTVTNLASGTITGFNAGVGVTGNGSVNNAGSITGTDGIDVTGTGIVLNTGTVTAVTDGVLTGGASSSVTLQGGSITAGGGGSNDVSLTGATSSVTINGRTLLTANGPDLHDTVNDGTLNLHLVGITPGQAALIVAAEGAAAAAPGTTFTVFAGGETYSFQGFDTFHNSFVSLENSVDSGLQQLGARLDAVGLPIGTPGHTPYDVFYNAALLSPEAAVEALSGRVLTQGTNDVEINSRSGLLSELGNQFDDLLESHRTGGIDFSHFTIGTDQMLAFTDTSSELTNLIQASQGEIGGTEMSDSKTMVPTASTPGRWGIWASGTVQVANKSSRTGNEGFNAVNGSPSLGLDYRITQDLTIGGLFSYTTIGANFSDGSNIESSTELGGVYGLWEHGGWRVHAVAAGGVSQYRDTRTTFDGSADSRPDGSDVISDLTGGYAFNVGDGFQVTPQTGLQYTHLHQDGFSEAGDPAYEINRGDFDADSLRTHVGFNVQRGFQIANGLQFTPQLRAAWYHECMDGNDGVDTSLPGAPALGSFSIRTFEPERDYALVGVGLSTSFTGYANMPVGLFLNYDVQVGQSDFTQHNVNAGVRVEF
jgi:outer membrane autotransporter protein